MAECDQFDKFDEFDGGTFSSSNGCGKLSQVSADHTIVFNKLFKKYEKL